MNETEIILQFLAFLAYVNAMFREVHLFAGGSPALRDISTTVIPFRSESFDYADGGVTISVALNAELVKPVDPERKAIGMSILICHRNGVWVAEADIGWSGEQVGWDPIESREAQSASIQEIASTVSPLVEWMDMRFRQEVVRLST